MLYAYERIYTMRDGAIEWFDLLLKVSFVLQNSASFSSVHCLLESLYVSSCKWDIYTNYMARQKSNPLPILLI